MRSDERYLRRVNSSQIEMRKIAVDQLLRLQRATTNDDVIGNDVTSAAVTTTPTNEPPR